MDALFTSFLAALLAEWGDKTQLLVAALATRYAKPGAVLAAVALAALANSAIAAHAGGLVSGFITLRAISLLVAVALLLTGVAGLMRARTPDMGASWKVGAFLTSLVCFFLLEFGDKTQFMTAALAAQFDSVWLAAIGATVGVTAANIPAVVLGARFADVVPLRAIRLGVAILFLLVGVLVAINALRLV